MGQWQDVATVIAFILLQWLDSFFISISRLLFHEMCLYSPNINASWQSECMRFQFVESVNTIRTSMVIIGLYDNEPSIFALLLRTPSDLCAGLNAVYYCRFVFGREILSVAIQI
jgi:hypothetical protein